MKFSSQEEYGLRCLIRIGKSSSQNGLTIPEISELEGLSEAHVGKILRVLRLGGFIESSRGQTGGYKLSRAPNKIVIGEVLSVLGGKLFESGFCENHSGIETICTHTIDCSIRSLWSIIQNLLDSVLSKTTLQNLLGTENETRTFALSLSEEVEKHKLSANKILSKG